MKKIDKQITALEVGIEKAQEILKELKEKKEKQEPKFEVGKWYRSKEQKEIIFFAERIEGQKVWGYGFNEGIWKTDTFFAGFHNPCLEASKEEVEQALIAEAKKRGFKEGVSIKAWTKGSYKIFGSQFRYNAEENRVEPGIYECANSLYLGDCQVFKDGKWAEIIEDKLEINGQIMEINSKGIVEFGCAKFDKDDLKQWYKAIKPESTRTLRTNRKIKSIILDSGVEITIEELKQICDKL